MVILKHRIMKADSCSALKYFLKARNSSSHKAFNRNYIESYTPGYFGRMCKAFEMPYIVTCAVSFIFHTNERKCYCFAFVFSL